MYYIGHIVYRYPYKMGRQNKWKIIMDVEVQDPTTMTFSDKDLRWSELFQKDNLLFDRVALIPSHIVPGFIKGKESNPNAPCTFLCIVRKPPRERGIAPLRYEL